MAVRPGQQITEGSPAIIFAFWDTAWEWLTQLGATAGVAVLVIALLVTVFFCWGLTLAGLPGNWLMLITASFYDFIVPEGRLAMGKYILIAMLVLALVGEALEMLTGALGVARKGGSRRGAVASLIGSMLGGLAGAVIGLPIPIPVVGSVIGLVLCAGLGAMIGAIVGERSAGKDLPTTVDIGIAAMWGRIIGSLAKTVVGGVMVAVAVAGLVL